MQAYSTGHVFLRKGTRSSVWYAKFRLPDGTQQKRKLGPAWAGRGRAPEGHYTKNLAEAKLREILTQADEGQITSTAVKSSFASVADAWLHYIEFDRQRAKSTVLDYQFVVRVHLKPFFTERDGETSLPIRKLDRTLVEQLRQHLLNHRQKKNGRPLAPVTINRILVTLHGIVKYAMRYHGLPSNPVALVERQPVHRTGDFSVLSAPEVMTLAKHATNDSDTALYITAAFSGLRMGELRALRWQHIDFEHRFIHVKRNYVAGEEKDPKSHRVRSVPLLDQVETALRNLGTGKPNDLIFCEADGGYLGDDELRYRYEKALKAAGLQKMRFHDLRHTFGTLAVRHFPLSDVQAFMGHANIQTTMIYVHHRPQTDAATKFSDAVRRDMLRAVEEDENLVPNLVPTATLLVS